MKISIVRPEEERYSSKFIKIGAGHNFSAAITNIGELYMWGNFLMDKKKEDNLDLLRIIEKRMIKIPPNFNYLYIPKKIKFFDFKHQVKNLSCGNNHIIVVDTNFNAFGWGKNDKGQLGIGKIVDYEKNPILINKDDNQKFMKSICNSDHSFLIDKKQDLYGFGFNFNGVLGLGVYNYNKIIPFFTKIDISKVIKLSTSKSHTLVLCEQKENKINWLNSIIDKKSNNNIQIYAWGNNSYGQLGLNDKEIRPSPVCLNSFIKFKSISAGLNCSAGISIDNNLYVWGLLNNFSFENVKEKIESLLPLKKDILNKLNIQIIKKIKLGDFFNIIITGNNNLYYWGDFPIRINKEYISNPKLTCLKFFKRKFVVTKYKLSSSHLLLLNQGSVYFLGKNNCLGFELKKNKVKKKKYNFTIKYDKKIEDLELKRFRFLEYMLINEKEKVFFNNSSFKYSDISKISVLKSSLQINKSSKSLFIDQTKFYSTNELNSFFQNLYKYYLIILQKENLIKKYEIIKKEKFRELKFIFINRFNKEPFNKKILEIEKKANYQGIYSYEYILNEKIYQKLFKSLYIHPCYLLK